MFSQLSYMRLLLERRCKLGKAMRNFLFLLIRRLREIFAKYTAIGIKKPAVTENNYHALHEFGPVKEAWRPHDKHPVYYIHWTFTEWCNYSCPYCSQTHSRFASKGRYTAHAFDNHSPGVWIEAFQKHFAAKRLSLKITGGEPMLDKKNMPDFLWQLTEMHNVMAIRIDTNASWSPKPYLKIDREKIILMCTFHPSQTGKAEFLNNIKSYLAEGFSIGMVNYVIAGADFAPYYALRDELASLGVPLHPNPLWGANGVYSHDKIELFRSELPDIDYYFRTGIGSPRGKPCFHPVVAYHLNQNGAIFVGCHPEKRGLFFSTTLPKTYDASPRCPSNSCVCLDMYSFLTDVNRNISINPLYEYSKLLLGLRPG